MKQTLLLVEDDKNLADGLLVSLEQAGYECLHAELISEVEGYWEQADLVILDRQLPDGDSVDSLPGWKKKKDIPVILLTALVTVKDKVAGLDSGANDYLTKPFDMDELLMRIHALLKRSNIAINNITLGKITFDFDSNSLQQDGTIIESRHQHDYKSYVDTIDGNTYFVDGGLSYSRGNYSAEGAVDLRIYDLDDHSLIREYFTWGSYGKCGSKPLEYILLKNISDEHINAILKTQTHIPTYVFNMFIDELDYREENDIAVEDNYG